MPDENSITPRWGTLAFVTTFYAIPTVTMAYVAATQLLQRSGRAGSATGESIVVAGAVAVGILVVGAAFAAQVWFHALTRFTPDGIRQRGFRGSTFIAWTSVDEVTRALHVIYVRAGTSRVQLVTTLFRNPEIIERLIQVKVRRQAIQTDRLAKSR